MFKHLAPALRLGWLVAPTQLVAPLAEIKANMDLGTDVIAQLALADVIASGMLYDRHLRRSRAAYRKRRDALAEVLAQSPVFEVSGITAGLHVLIALPNSFDENALAAHARELGFTAQPLGRYRHQPGPPGIVGYGALTPDAIRSRATKLVKFAGRIRR